MGRRISAVLIGPADLALDELVGEDDDVDDHLGEGAQRGPHHDTEPASELS